jgi:hypothetical protein
MFILVCLGVIFYFSIILPNICLNKLKHLRNPQTEPEAVCNISNLTKLNINNHQRISLKGRVKRNPNNINYNELFIDGSGKLKKKKGLIKKEVEEEEKFISNNNLDDFFERVNEKNEFEKIFINNNKEVDTKPNKEISIMISQPNPIINLTPFEECSYNLNSLHTRNISNNNCNDLLLFEDKKNDESDTKLNNNKESIFKSEENNIKLVRLIQYAIHTSPIPTINLPNRDTIEIKVDKGEFPIEEELDEGQRMENKMRNSDLFAQTPLTNIRRNTNSKK